MNNIQNNKKWLALSAGLTIAATGAIAPSAEAASFNLDFDAGVSDSSYYDNGTLKGDNWSNLGVTISAKKKNSNTAAQLNLYNTDLMGGLDDDLETGADFGTLAQGNALIIQERRKSDNYDTATGRHIADDEAGGGSIDFSFDTQVAFTAFSLLDIDDNGGGISVIGNGLNGTDPFELNIDVDRLIEEHNKKYNISTKIKNGNRVDRTSQNTIARKAEDAQGKSYSEGGVTVTQVGTRIGDNSMYRFELDETHFANIRLNNVEFKYPGSGAISGIEWRTDDAPKDIPEPSVVGGLLMLGFVGARKRLKRNEAAVA